MNELFCRICKTDGHGTTTDNACDVCYANAKSVDTNITCMKCKKTIAYYKRVDNYDQGYVWDDGFFCGDCVIK